MVGTTTDLQAGSHTHSSPVPPSESLPESLQTLSLPLLPRLLHNNHSFLARTLLGVAIGSFELFHPTSILTAQEPPVKENTQGVDTPAVTQRAALLQKISSIASSSIHSSGVDSTVQKIESIRPLVAEYRQLLNGPIPPNLQELSQARSLVFSPLNTIHFSAQVPSQHAQPFFRECVIDFYRDLSKHFRRVAGESPLDKSLIADELDRIFKDTLYIAHHHDPLLCAEAVNLIEGQFLIKEEGTYLRIYREISSHPLFSSEPTHTVMAGIFACRYLNEISQGVSAEISYASKEGVQIDTSTIVQLLELPKRLKKDLITAKNVGALQDKESEECIKRVHELLQVPIEQVAAQLWRKSYCERNPFVQPGQFAQFGRFLFAGHQDVPDGVSLPDRDAQTIALCDLYDDSSSCRVKLGDQFVYDLYGKGAGNTPIPVPALQVLYVVTHLAPRPQNKTVLVDALREAVISRSSTESGNIHLPRSGASKELGSEQFGALLSMLLLTDFTFCATSECVAGNPDLATALVRELSASPEDLGNRYLNILPPAQILLIELLRIYRGGALAESVPWYRELPLTEKADLRKKSSTILSSLASSIYEVQPIGIFSPKKSEFTYVSYPEPLRAGVIRAPDLTRLAPFQRAIGSFCELGDVVAEQLVHPSVEITSERDEIMHLVVLTQLLEGRRSAHAVGGQRASSFVEKINERYADLSSPPKNGPFFSCREGVLALLSGKNRGRQNPELPWEKITKGSPEFLADSYARQAEIHFIVAFSLTLFGEGDAPESRVISGMRGLEGGSVARRVDEIVRQYDFATRDKRLRSLFDGPKSELQSGLVRYKEELEVELRGLSEQIKKRIPSAAP